eukprot:Gb_28729 [translate_table: standard]
MSEQQETAPAQQQQQQKQSTHSEESQCVPEEPLPLLIHNHSQAGEGHKFYPPPLVKHEEVVANRDLFFDTLNKFHSALGTRFMVPTIGGKELDLHLLYVEVTARGGLEQVIKDRKWKEITGVFNFPPTTTSASFVLRKYYISLLHHYEQVYFFQSQGRLFVPTAPLPVPSPIPQSTDNGLVHRGSDGVQPVIKKRKRRSFSIPPPVGVDPASSVDQPVTGIIDGKFEHGYLVTVKVGSDTLRGVLYHVSSGGSGAQFAGVSCFQSNNSYDAEASGTRARRRKKKDGMRKRDPSHPKPNRSGYNFFFAEQHAKLKALHPDKDREISKMIGELWNKLKEEERAVYQECGLKDKERYKKEMQEYKERLKMQPLTNEVLNQELDKLPDSCEHRPDHHLLLRAEAKGDVPSLSTQSGTTDVNISAELKSSIQDNDHNKPISEQGAYG